MLYLQSCKCLYGAVPNQKQELLYILGHVITSIWTAEKYDEAVEFTKCL